MILRRASQFLSGAGSIAVATAVMSVGTYGFTIIAARLLGPGDYGAVAGLMAVLLVVGVFQLGLQTTAARRIAASPEHTAAVEQSVLRVARRTALVLGALMLLLAPLVRWLLRLDDLLPAILLALASVPVTLMGAQAGILQGERRWRSLALLYVANGVPRLLLGTVILAWRPTVVAALIAVAVAQWAPVIVGNWALRHRAPSAAPSVPPTPAIDVLRESLGNSHALAAFLALSSVDILVARSVLDEHAAGLYAGGLILTKAVLFLPQFVVILAFPSMSTARTRRRALLVSSVAVIVVGLIATGGAWLFPDLALTFVGGSDYAAVTNRLWLFALLGTSLALLQIVVYSVVARQGRKSIYVVWIACGAILLVALGADSAASLAWRVLCVDAVVVTGLLVASVYRLRHDGIARSDV